MTRLDRYIIAQIWPTLGFFVLVFTGVVWLSQAVRLIDTIVASGQTASVFLEFSALVLPQVFVIVLPLSGIGAALYTLNKLYSDSEMVVMMNAGIGPMGFLRPVSIFGIFIAACMYLVLLVLVPWSGTMLAERTQAIRSDIATALIVERQFLHPIPGLTLFITDTVSSGEMSGIFINDRRDPAHPITYSAAQAQLLRDDMEARLVLFDGITLAPSASGEDINSIKFDQFVFDLTDLIKNEAMRVPRPSEYSVWNLLWPTAKMLSESKYSVNDYVAEAHYKMALPLLAMVFPMIALVTLLAGGFRRSGFGRRVFVAVGVSLTAQILMFLARDKVQADAHLWPLMYLPLLGSVLYMTVLIVRMKRLGRPTRHIA